MELKNTLVNVKTKLLSILKIIALIFLLWIFLPFEKADTFNNYLGKDNEPDSILKLRFNRLLTKHETLKKLEQANLKEKEISDYRKNNVIKNNAEDTSTYAYSKKVTSNPLDVYKKGFKKRYARKRGFAKLECHCENKLFHRIDELYNLADSMKKDKSAFIKALIKKYRKHIYFVIFFYILAALICMSEWILEEYDIDAKCFESYEDFKYLTRTVGGLLGYIIPTILLFVIIYIFIKSLKYECLKAGRDKMNIKEYFKYCKEVLNLKK